MNIRNYLDYKVGQTNIVISAPHGGYLKSSAIPHRTYGTFVKDTGSLEVVNRMYFSNDPTFITAKIHRDRVDLNREVNEAAQGNPIAEFIWTTWHKFLDAHCIPGAIYVDIHSHNNSDEFQLGFNLSKQDYLELENHPEYPKYEHVYGEFSINRSLEKAGYKVYKPKYGEVYFNGGYDIERHGKYCDALQIEMPVSVIKNNYEQIAKVLVEAIERYNFNEVQK